MSLDPITPSPTPHPTADGPDALLEVRTWRLKSLRILRLVGELDALTASRVRVTLDEVLSDRHRPLLVVDLTHLTFMASAGVGLLVEIRQRVGGRAGRMVVVLAARSHPRRLFELTRMVDHFETASTLRQAVHALRQAEDDPVPPGATGATPPSPPPADRPRGEG
ncbi:STAS domain-containing protein [Streptosporangium sp. DT93]|uniref:STAS domain-containing protein n=1 Tax=Streptosporangium sp. DT93 TaxID=3393428 RepID=UPI003CF1A50D